MKWAAPALIAGALAAPTDAAQHLQDLRNAGAKDAAARVQSGAGLRSPDARGAVKGGAHGARLGLGRR
jgi:hypothetical protein